MSPRSHRLAVIRHAAVACAFAFVASVLPAAEVELNDSVGGAVTEDEGKVCGYRVGTFLVDRAIAAFGRTAADLVTVTSEGIVRLAGYR